MGTLTGNTPSRPEHCPHKLPTSCRLTATSLCCACLDKRPHSFSYSTYVDGIGMAMRGTRWQKYCWYCKEFWCNRVTATIPPIAAGQTRVPEVPDQTEFVAKWHQYHKGYRIVKSEITGSECRENMLCEIPWKDVAPGHLPVINEVDRVLPLEHAPQFITQTVPHVSLEATLDDMIEAATAEQESTMQSRHSNNMDVSRHQIPSMSFPQDNGDQLREVNAQLAAIQGRRRHAADYLRRMDRELRACEARRLLTIRDQITAENMTRLFGTREEIARQGADYVSPLTNMFARAYERYGVAEEVRAVERSSTQNTDHQRPFSADIEQVLAMGRASVQNADDQLRNLADLARQNFLDLPRRNHSAETINPTSEDHVDENLRAQRPLTLDDEGDDRPPPQSEEDMTVKLVCKICLQQPADIAVLPCGHLVMCSFCAAIWVPPRSEDHTQPLRKTSCPLCRKRIKRRVRIFAA